MFNTSMLGQKAEYNSHYNPDLLFPIPRQAKRDEIAVPSPLPFFGFDLWNHYEVSWLNEKGKPMVAIAKIIYSCDSPNIIESKSMKLYFNSLNNTSFKDAEAVQTVIKRDLEQRVGATVTVSILPLSQTQTAAGFSGICLDALDIACDTYVVDPALLQVGDAVIEETLYSDLLKSNCLVTGQPDWGSIQIAYQGRQIHHAGLLRYIVSFRNHHEFHEQCIERIFMDILRVCQPKVLTVYGRYTRRGGLDINPYRTTQRQDGALNNVRLCRQ